MPNDIVIVEVTDDHLDIMKNKNMKMLEEDGTFCNLYQKKTSGTRCSCWDERRQQAKRDCPTCFGTSWEGGYDKVEDILFRFPMTVREIIWTEHGLNVEQIPRVWTISDETIKIRDFLHRQSDGERFVLKSVEKALWRNKLMHIQAEVEIVDPEDILKQVP